MKTLIDRKKLAAIQYVGRGGITSACIDAISRLIHFGDTIKVAKLLSYTAAHHGVHCFLLEINYGDQVAVKSGFSSGYSGEGPGGLSRVLQLLSRHGAEIDEYNVDEEFIDRVDHSCLLIDDLEFLERARPVRPNRWYDYIENDDYASIYNNRMLKGMLPIAVPFEIVDLRIMDLALKLVEDPDGAITSGYRRLEDIVRNRAGLKSESGSKLFSKCFQGEQSRFYWGDIDGGEHSGKAALFTAVFNAYRNRRAHREIDSDPSELLREFLLINELFVLESQAIGRPAESTEHEQI